MLAIACVLSALAGLLIGMVTGLRLARSRSGRAGEAPAVSREAHDAPAREQAASADARTALPNERAAFANERDALANERAALAEGRDALAHERSALASQHDALAGDRAVLAAEKDALAKERAASADEHDTLAAELLDLAYLKELPEVRRRATAMALRLGGRLIRPQEEAPFDDRLHEADQVIRTADAVRHGVTAGVVRPGLCNRNGVILRRAVVYRYVWNDRPQAKEPVGRT